MQICASSHRQKKMSLCCLERFSSLAWLITAFLLRSHLTYQKPHSADFGSAQEWKLGDCNPGKHLSTRNWERLGRVKRLDLIKWRKKLQTKSKIDRNFFEIKSWLSASFDSKRRKSINISQLSAFFLRNHKRPQHSKRFERKLFLLFPVWSLKAAITHADFTGTASASIEWLKIQKNWKITWSQKTLS